MTVLRHPPGRAGRMWLERRLAAAVKAADLLDRKRQALLSETQRMHLLSARARQEWERSMAETRAWAAKFALLAGEAQAAMLAVELGSRAEVDVRWQSIMGVAYPADVSVHLPERTSTPLAGTAAYDQLEPSAQRSLRAALEHAAAARSYEVLSRELANTSRRSRLIEKRRAPDLRSALHGLELALEERDRDEGVRLRWVARRQRRREAPR